MNSDSKRAFRYRVSQSIADGLMHNVYWRFVNIGLSILLYLDLDQDIQRKCKRS